MIDEKFPWGTITKVHTIGTHTITEYVVGREWAGAGRTEFHCYEASHDMLDSAILWSLACKYAGGDAAPYAAKVLGMGECT